MQAIVHIGIPKSGSTSLQNALAFSSSLLKKNEVLYPMIRNMGNNHFFLGAILLGNPGYYRIYNEKYNQVNFIKEKDKFLKSIDRQIQWSNPKTLILSAESLSPYPVCIKAKNLYDMLSKWTKDIKIVCYLRDPITLYMSTIQQQLKASCEFENPYNFRLRYRESLENYDQAFKGNVSVISFDISSFPKKSIYHNFIREFLPHIYPIVEKLKFEIHNKSPDIEVSKCLQDFRKVNYPYENDKFNLSTNIYYKCLLEASGKISHHTSKSIKKEYEEIILANNLEDIIWLKERYNIEFSNIDINKIKISKNNGHKKITSLSDVVDINYDYAKILEQTVLHEILENKSRKSFWIKKNIRKIKKKYSNN